MFFAACLCASMSMFVSCKDYDDDINNLQEQITTNASTLDEMVKEKINNLTIEIEALKAQDATLETALANARTEFEQAVADAKSYADIQAAAAQAAAIEASKKNIEDACALLQASIDAANAELDALSSKVSTQEETINGLLNADKELQSAIDIANGEIQSAKDMAIAAQQKADQNAEILNGVIEKLATVKEDLDNQISVLGEKVDDALKQIAANKAEADAQLAEVNALIESNAEAITALQDKDKAILEMVKENSQKLADMEKSLAAIDEKLAANLDAAKAYTDAQVAALKVELGVEIEKVQGEIDDAVERIIAAEGKLAEIDKTIEGLKTDFSAELNELSKSVEESINAIKTEIGKINDLIKTIQATVTEHSTDIKNLQEKAAVIEKKLEETNATLKLHAEAISQILDRLSLESKKLKSLVFSPQEYYQGIEAIGVWSFNYNAMGGFATPDLNKDQTDDQVKNYALKETSVVPVVTASYYMNPSNAAVDTAKANYSFIISNANYTRAASASDITVDSVKKDNKITGLLNVYFSMKNANSIASISNGKVDVAALRYNGNDTIITSDFAALKQYKINDFFISKSATGNAAEDNGLNQLAKTAAEAVKHDAAGKYDNPILEIAYNNTKGINLDEWINVYYQFEGSQDVKFWGDQAEVNKKKFKLAYELIGYVAKDADGTNESKHATIDGSILTVHGVDGAEASRKIIGRTPLVRVTLVDENTNSQIAEVGYIVVKITDVTTEPVIVPEADIKDVTNGYTLACDDVNALDNVTAITWDEVENHVLGTLDMSKEEFEKNYTLELNWNTQNAAQYSYDANKNEFTVIAVDDQIGTIINTKDGTTGYQTNVLKWTVGNNQAYHIFVVENKTSITVWVKFKPNNTVYGQRDVYVPLTWKPADGTLNIAPEATINNSDKKAADWHAANSREAGFDELHIQVGNATDPSATCEYQSMTIENTFSKNPVKIITDAIGETYKALAANASVTYKFADINNQAIKSYKIYRDGKVVKTYNITVTATQMFADGQELAKINPVDGKIELNKDNNDVLKEIINNYEKGELANALTMTVVVEPKTCEPGGGMILLNNNIFNVKVIKPVFIVGSKITDMQLNNFSTLTQDVSLSFLDFNDYDPDTFWKNSNKQKTFWDFYGVSSIKLAGNIQTDYSGKKADVDANDFVVTYTEPQGGITLSNMGKVTLTQKNMSLANSFKVYIPLAVTYKWGVLYETVELNVKAASGTAVKRR